MRWAGFKIILERKAGCDRTRRRAAHLRQRIYGIVRAAIAHILRHILWMYLGCVVRYQISKRQLRYTNPDDGDGTGYMVSCRQNFRDA
jgi:hypothetical protein